VLEKPGATMSKPIVFISRNTGSSYARSRRAGQRAYRFIESAGFEIYGAPNDGVLQMMKRIAGSGIPVRARPRLLGGYLRLTA
jgi:hypothetical protein